jgi:glycosyltransferase involved in cell wall biosynthesis
MILNDSEILVSCGSQSWGGMEIMALENAKQLLKQGFKVKFACNINSQLYENTMNAGIEIICSLKNNKRIHNYMQFANVLKNHNIKLIHTHFSNDLWTIVPALKLRSSNAGLFLTKHLASGIVKKDLFHKFLYNRVNKIFAISNFIKKNVEETCPVPEESIILLPNGVDLNHFSMGKYYKMDFRNEFGIPADKTVIGLIGRITPGKGHREFIEAIELLNKSISGNTVYIVTGSSAKDEEHFEEELEQLAKEKNIDNIIFTGYRNDTAAILAGLDILSFPSHEESFGITLLEAMAMNVPVIASNNAGITDVIPSNEYGMLIPPKDSKALADAILILITDTEQRKKLASNGRKRVEENYNIENITKDLIRYYALG